LESVEFNEGLGTINSSAFKGCTKLEEAILPEGLSSVGSNAFQNCTSLQKAVLPDTVTSLGTYAFQKCSALTDITLSEGMTTLPSYVLANCTSLESVVIPKGVTKVNDHAFYQDTKLKNITVPQTVTTVSTDNVVSYPTRTTIYGCTGTYAETWANDKKMTFVDITKKATAIQLANGTNKVQMEKGQTIAPDFTFDPIDSTDIITMTSSDKNTVAVSGNRLTAKKDGKATITVTTTSGATFSFTVQVGEEPSVIMGDVNGDTKVNGADVYRLFRHVNKQITLTDEQLKAADVNKDSKVNGADVYRLFRYVNKQIESL